MEGSEVNRIFKIFLLSSIVVFNVYFLEDVLDDGYDFL